MTQPKDSFIRQYDPIQDDSDVDETKDWIGALDALVDHKGVGRANFLLGMLLKRARLHGVSTPELLQTPYINTIAPEDEPAYPGDLRMEQRIRRIIRWNAVMMVHRANHLYHGIGGHLSTYASAATLYEVGFNHFFRGKEDGLSGDQIFFQGHASPGIYARALLEGRLTSAQLESFRRETGPAAGIGLSSYPHPWLMPDFWEFPTVSMGLAPITAIYQAKFNRYLQHRGIKDTSNSRVWAFLGDGETDEPEALGALSVAAREGLDNLTFVVNCNLQRLDGPVRGNGKIIQELESVFHGAGWNVIKVIWGAKWDKLLEQDTDGALMRRMEEAVDGDYQKYSTERDSPYIREHFFGKYPQTLSMVADKTDAELWGLRRGGHDAKKVHAAYKAATEHKGQPTVILAKTVKGWTLGQNVLGKNIAHQQKELSLDDLKSFRDEVHLPIADKELKNSPFYIPQKNSPEIQYLMDRRSELGGSIPHRRTKTKTLDVPSTKPMERFFQGSGETSVSTTGAFGQVLATLLRDPNIGRRIVPIIPDEARTFGLDALFGQYGIYSSIGQLYEPVDKKMLLHYREAKDGQVLEEGITEAGSMASFTAAGTAYTHHDEPMIPFYIFYSMFGLQRTGDQAWAFGDCRGRGFLLGATAGRTTLNGEGLQHEDGHSHLLASTIPNLVSYEPAFAYEVAVIVQDGLRRMYEDQEDIFYYITLQNENYTMPAMPEGVRDGILKGLYLFQEAPKELAGKPTVQLLGSGSILNEVIRAQGLLAEMGIAAPVWNATGYLQLRRDALEAGRWNMLNPNETPKRSYLEETLGDVEGPFVATSDWLKAVPDQISKWVPGEMFTLGTDGYGRSDTRKALRRHFEIDAEFVCVAALSRLARKGDVSLDLVTETIKRFEIDPEKANPIFD